jgi:hypothetical protein
MSTNSMKPAEIAHGPCAVPGHPGTYTVTWRFPDSDVEHQGAAEWSTFWTSDGVPTGAIIVDFKKGDSECPS